MPEARMIQIQPWEKKIIKDIEKAILMSDIGINPTNDGTVIRLEEIDAILAKIKDAVCEILNAVREEQSKIDDSILECEADHDTK